MPDPAAAAACEAARAAFGDCEDPAIFDRYAPQPGWFADAAEGPHGHGHAARVLFWADAIGRLMQEDGIAVDLEVVRWAAVLHDSRRVSEGSDPAHGRRAATWARETNLAPLWRLSPAAREAVSYCCEWHVPPDREAPRLTAELVCLKDADSLDRVRFGTLQRRFLRTPYAHRFATAAQMLFDASRTCPPGAELQWVAVRAAAGRLREAGAAPVESTWPPGGCCFTC